MIDSVLARRLRLVGFDVDGVLSDGGIYIGRVGDHPVELKRFDSQDGSGAWLLRKAGLTLALVSGRRSDATAIRAREMKIDEVIEDESGGGYKLQKFEAMLARRGIAWDECVFVGDDLADLPLLKRVAVPIAVANAVPEVKHAAAIVTQSAGGHGVVREVAVTILRARGVWDEVVQQYLEERGDAATPAAGSR